MDLFRALQNEKKALHGELNRLFSVATLEDVMALPEPVDLFLMATLRGCVARYAPAFFGAESDVNELSIKCAGYSMEVLAGQNLGQEKTLEIRVLIRDASLNPNRIKNYSFSVKLKGIGQFSAVAFEVPRVVPRIEEGWLKQFASELFWVGYNWLNQTILSRIREECKDTNKDLYNYMRSMVLNQELLRGFLFSAVSDGKDFVVLDDSSFGSSLGLATESARNLGRGAADIVLQMMLEIVPVEDSVIRDAIKHPDGVDIDLSRDRYYQSDNSFSQALRAVWGNSVSCFPVLREAPVLLVAFYMTKYKNDLLPLLQEHRDALYRIASDRRAKIMRNLSLITRVRPQGLAGQAAEVVGRLLGGYMKAHEG